MYRLTETQTSVFMHIDHSIGYANVLWNDFAEEINNTWTTYCIYISATNPHINAKANSHRPTIKRQHDTNKIINTKRTRSLQTNQKTTKRNNKTKRRPTQNTNNNTNYPHKNNTTNRTNKTNTNKRQTGHGSLS